MSNFITTNIQAKPSTVSQPNHTIQPSTEANIDVTQIWHIQIPSKITAATHDTNLLNAELKAAYTHLSFVAKRARTLLNFLKIEQESTLRYKSLYEKAKQEIAQLRQEAAKPPK